MANRSLNKVMLIGNLTRDPELRYTPSGTAVCTFGLATNRSWTTDAGEKKEEAEFHRLVAWAKLAEICGKFLTKGRKVYVEGRLQTRSWTGQDGQQRQTTEIVIDDMIILDTRRMLEEGGYEGSGVEPSSFSKTPPTSANIAKKAEVAEKKAESTEEKEKVKEDKKGEKEDNKSKDKVKMEENVPAGEIPF